METEKTRQNEERSLPCTLISWTEIESLCSRLAQQIRASGFQPEIIVAIGRGGWIPGRILSDLLGIMNLTGFKLEHYRGAHKAQRATIRYPLTADITGLRVLLVDDVSDSGDTFSVALQHVQSRGQAASIKTAVLHHKTVSKFTPDLYAEALTQWRWLIYPWAVTEDIASFVADMVPLPATWQEIQQRLQKTHGISVTPQQIEHALQIVSR